MMLFAVAALATPLVISTPPKIAPMPNLFQPSPAVCGDIQRRVREDQKETLRRLGSLPNAGATYAVERKIGPCGVPTPMGYHPPSLPGAADQAPH